MLGLPTSAPARVRTLQVKSMTTENAKLPSRPMPRLDSPGAARNSVTVSARLSVRTPSGTAPESPSFVQAGLAPFRWTSVARPSEVVASSVGRRFLGDKLKHQHPGTQSRRSFGHEALHHPSVRLEGRGRRLARVCFGDQNSHRKKKKNASGGSDG